MRVVTFYNHKGGVSKTTTAFNTAAYLASRKRKKVLIVDADPQGNITEQFFSPPANEEDYDLPGTSIFQALKPRFEGAATHVDVRALSLPSHHLYPQLSILRGDWQFSHAERFFGNALAFAITENVYEKHTYVVLYRLFQDLISHFGYDHIIVDLGPSSGAVTNVALMSCDGYFIPVTPDRFCTQAVRVLTRLIADWIRRHQAIVPTLKPFGIDRYPGNPVFLGAITQNFKAYAGRTRTPYKYWEDKISEIIRNDFGEAHLPTTDSATVSYVAAIKDLGGLAPVAQMVGKAIFDLDRTDTERASASGSPWSGVALDSWLERARAYEAEVAKIAGAIRNG